MLKQYVLLAVVAMGLFGCASVPMGDSNKDAALKTFGGNSDIAGVYIYRNESLGPGLRMIVQVDGRPLGQTAPRVYLYTEISPGKHVITSTTLNPFTGNSENETDSLEFEAIAGKRYYIWQEVKPDWNPLAFVLPLPWIYLPHPKLHLVDEPEGQKGVLETKLAVSQ
ncbi:lipoprotein [Ferrigenium kumadai]|uniref:Lipoprotein n=1 Tax=Ferrigenium kumadai TaxID=1682490 RepID=A0AAN1VZ60_9PROT|nr:DUF2846 domain-containing protein [Ferrigenium kumadai]BBI99004.1 lipoprotein [Ferrigenium kumadai]